MFEDGEKLFENGIRIFEAGDVLLENVSEPFFCIIGLSNSACCCCPNFRALSWFSSVRKYSFCPSDFRFRRRLQYQNKSIPNATGTRTAKVIATPRTASEVPESLSDDMGGGVVMFEGSNKLVMFSKWCLRDREEYLPIDHMNNPILHKQVRSSNFSAVDKCFIHPFRYCEVFPLNSPQYLSIK